jgi:peptidoglycan/LPS O-acetylase OafA/YrhL
MNRNGSIEYARFLGALGIVWFHMKMPGGTTALAALQLFILLQVYFGAERALSPQARRLLVPWLLWSAIYAVGKISQAWLQNSSVFGEFEHWMLFTGPSIHLWYLPFSFACVVLARVMLQTLTWPVIYALTVLLAAGSLAFTNLMDLTIPLAQWSSVTAAAVIGLLVKGPVPSRVVLSMSIIATGFAVYVLGWDSGAWQTLVAAGVFFFVTEIKLPSTEISRKLSEISFGIYLIHPAVYSILMPVAEPGMIVGYALVISLSSVAVYLLRRLVPVLV